MSRSLFRWREKAAFSPVSFLRCRHPRPQSVKRGAFLEPLILPALCSRCKKNIKGWRNKEHTSIIYSVYAIINVHFKGQTLIYFPNTRPDCALPSGYLHPHGRWTLHALCVPRWNSYLASHNSSCCCHLNEEDPPQNGLPIPPSCSTPACNGQQGQPIIPEKCLSHMILLPHPYCHCLILGPLLLPRFFYL